MIIIITASLKPNICISPTTRMDKEIVERGKEKKKKNCVISSFSFSSSSSPSSSHQIKVLQIFLRLHSIDILQILEIYFFIRMPTKRPNQTRMCVFCCLTFGTHHFFILWHVPTTTPPPPLVKTLPSSVQCPLLKI